MLFPVHTYRHDSWIMTIRVQSQMQVSEMRFLQKIKGAAQCLTNFVTTQLENFRTSSQYV